MQVVVWGPILLATSFLAFGLSAYVFARYFDGNRALVASFLGISVGAGWWALTYAIQLSSTSLSGKLFWLQLVWFGPALLMVAWPAFVLLYTGRERWVRETRLPLLLVVPLAALATVWTTGQTSVMYVDPAVETIHGIELLTFTPGPFLEFVVTYSIFINLFTYVLLGDLIVRGDPRYRRQATILLAAGLFPTIANVVGRTDLLVSPYLDLTPIAFFVTTPLIGWVLVRYRLLEVVPVARTVLFTDLSDGVVVVDGDGVVVDTNEVARTLFGDIDGKAATDVFEAHPALLELLREEDTQRDARMVVETSEETTILDVSSSTFSHRGVTGTVLLLTDVTNREVLSHRYKTLVEKSPNVIMTVESEGTVRYVSPSLERLLGYDLARFAGSDVQQYVHPDDRDELRAALQRVDGPDDAPLLDLRFQHADGGSRRFKTTVKRLHDEVLLVGTDITEQQRYRQRLQVLNRVLRHDLKNNVNVIQLRAEFLEKHVDEEGERHLDPILRKCEALENLSEMARDIDIVLSEGSELQTVDIVEAVRAAVDRLEGAYPGTTVRVDAPTEASVLIDQLYPSLFDNLLENAVEHNDRPDPEIDVTVERNSETVDVTIADNGPGLPKEERRVLDAERETPLDHTSGLGLWLVKWIVSRSGGEMTFGENEPRGTAIHLTFRREQNPSRVTSSEHSVVSQ